MEDYLVFWFEGREFSRLFNTTQHFDCLLDCCPQPKGSLRHEKLTEGDLLVHLMKLGVLQCLLQVEQGIVVERVVDEQLGHLEGGVHELPLD